ncbi:MAG: phosphatase PAP2/dual specificity phosphatase family protein [Myxococcales bacterium]|nr:phosphatase PAP2/dual specificity phosphatase family protein [Myxococcales bacterium]
MRFPGGRPWGWAALWGCFLAPMFFGTYIGALELTALRDHVPTLVFDWERHLPFLAWTVVPYWSEDLFYALSLFLCLTRAELNRHASRLVLAQAVAIPIFLLFPLRLVSTIPADTGIFAPWFEALGGVCTRPFNLAPSLHVAIAIILGVRYARHLRGPWRWLSNAWFTLIALSTLTTWQHHFFDIPTGAMLGAFCVWALPEEGPSPLRGLTLTHDPRRWRLAALYTAGAALCLVLAWSVGGTALWLLWPAQSLLLVSFAYAAAGERLFQKDASGRMSAAAQVLLYPYVVGARISAALFTRHLPDSEVVDGVRLGRLAPSGTTSVVDLSAELPAPAHADWRCLPTLDLVPPAPELLCEAARHIEARVVEGRTVLVCCALGFSRSAAAVATWLAASGRASDVDGALALVRAARPRVVLGEADRAVIDEAVRRLRETR